MGCGFSPGRNGPGGAVPVCFSSSPTHGTSRVERPEHPPTRGKAAPHILRKMDANSGGSPLLCVSSTLIFRNYRRLFPGSVPIHGRIWAQCCSQISKVLPVYFLKNAGVPVSRPTLFAGVQDPKPSCGSPEKSLNSDLNIRRRTGLGISGCLRDSFRDSSVRLGRRGSVPLSAFRWRSCQRRAARSLYCRG